MVDQPLPAIDADSITDVLDVLAPERGALVDLLDGSADAEWATATECPQWSVQGVATHVLGDDLSLLSRQRDGAVSGLVRVAETMPGADIPALLDAFNERWVEGAAFLGPSVLVDLLRATGQWTEDYYRRVDPNAPVEPVPMFGGDLGTPSPFWQAIAREYLERWTHQSQIRRALGSGQSWRTRRSWTSAYGSWPRSAEPTRPARSPMTVAGDSDRSISDRAHRSPTS